MRAISLKRAVATETESFHLVTNLIKISRVAEQLQPTQLWGDSKLPKFVN